MIILIINIVSTIIIIIIIISIIIGPAEVIGQPVRQERELNPDLVLPEKKKHIRILTYLVLPGKNIE